MKIVSSKWLLNCLTIGLVITTLAASNALAFAPHPYHVSRAEIQFNSETNKFQVALCVWPEDLEKAVAQVAKRSVDLDKTENVEDMIRDYVATQFRIVDANANVSANSIDKNPVVAVVADVVTDDIAKPDDAEPNLPETFRWIGYEMELKQAWLYFEIDAGEAKSWAIESRLFFELNDDQFNQVQVGEGSQLIAEACEPSSPTVEWSRE